MMRVLGSAVLLSLLVAELATAKTVMGTERFSCDTPGGRYSRYQRPLSAGPSRLSAVVHVNSLHDGTSWLPVVNVMLWDNSALQRLGFRLIPNDRTKKITIFGVFAGMKGSEVLRIGEADLNSEISLTIDASEQEAVLSANGMSRSGSGVSSASLNIDISCSSVDAHIDDIVIGG